MLGVPLKKLKLLYKGPMSTYASLVLNIKTEEIKKLLFLLLYMFLCSSTRVKYSECLTFTVHNFDPAVVAQQSRALHNQQRFLVSLLEVGGLNPGHSETFICKKYFSF